MKKRTIAIISLALCSNAAWAACNPNPNIPASTPDTDFVPHANGTVTHKTTGLMWKTCSEGLSGNDCTQGTATKMTWAAALKHVNDLNKTGFAGHKDWRLPNVKELTSIIERGCRASTVNETIFPNTPKKFFWSSSPYAKDGNKAWMVSFQNGNGIVGFAKSNDYHVRLVRAAQ